MTIALARTGDATAFPVAAFDAATRDLLERAAPIYRKAWWSRHRAMNQTYVARLQEARIDLLGQVRRRVDWDHEAPL